MYIISFGIMLSNQNDITLFPSTCFLVQNIKKDKALLISKLKGTLSFNWRIVFILF